MALDRKSLKKSSNTERSAEGWLSYEGLSIQTTSRDGRVDIGHGSWPLWFGGCVRWKVLVLYLGGHGVAIRFTLHKETGA